MGGAGGGAGGGGTFLNKSTLNFDAKSSKNHEKSMFKAWFFMIFAFLASNLKIRRHARYGRDDEQPGDDGDDAENDVRPEGHEKDAGIFFWNRSKFMIFGRKKLKILPLTFFVQKS